MILWMLRSDPSTTAAGPSDSPCLRPSPQCLTLPPLRHLGDQGGVLVQQR